MSWWDDILSDIADWGSDVWDSLAGFTDEVAKGYAWIGEGIGTLARAFYDAIIAYGEKIWDAFYNGFSFVRNGLMDLGNGIWVGLTRLGEYLKLGLDALWGALSWIGTQIFSFGKWLWAGISWIGSQLYNFGSWLWDALTWLGETVWDGLKWVGGNLWAGLKAFGQWTWSGVCWLGAQTAKLTKWMWDSITGFFKNLYDTVRTWMGGLTTGVNSWMSGLLGNYKDKIDDILFANMMVLGSKNIIVNLTEKAGDAKSLGEVGYHVLGSVGSGIALPIVGWIMKEVLAMTVKGVGGTDVKLFPPESDGLKYMPEFAYTSEDVPVEDRDPYRETTPQFDSGFTPGIVHAKPAAGTPPGTPVCGECPPSELFMPPGTPIPPDPPYVPPEPEDPVPPDPPFAKAISVEVKGGVPAPVLIPEAYYEIPVTVGGGLPSPGFIGMGEFGVEVGGGIPSVEVTLVPVWMFETIQESTNGHVFPDICLCQSGLPVVVWGDNVYLMFNRGRRLNGGWTCDSPTVQQNNAYSNRIKCRASDQYIRVSHYDSVNFNLKLLKQTGLTAFSDITIDSGGDVGIFASMDIDAGENEHIAYPDATNRSLKYAKWNGLSWDFESIEVGEQISHPDMSLIGVYPHIVYMRIGASYTDYSLRYSYKDGGGWHYELVDAGDSLNRMGSHNRMAIDSANVLHVVYTRRYRDGAVWKDDLKYAYRDGSGWHIETIESDVEGSCNPDIAVDSSNVPHISYLHGGTSSFKYGVRTGGLWALEVLDNVGSPGSYSSIHIEGGVIYIAYTRFTPKQLCYATKGV